MRLITPIANAVLVYQRRYLRDRNAHYEHLWRLVHLQEALIVSLGALTATRLLAIHHEDPEKRVIRNKTRALVTGYSDEDEDFNQRRPLSESCFTGSIGAWVSFLSWFSAGNYSGECHLLQNVREYLNHGDTAELAFLEIYRTISPNAEHLGGAQSRIRRFQAINTLRNKLAHVPLPFDLIEPLHHGLRKELFSAIISDYDRTKDNYDSYKFFDHLCGQFVGRTFIISGANNHSTNSRPEVLPENLLYFESKIAEGTLWPVSPFFHVDDVLNVSLLFRAPDFDPSEDIFKAEYHRFAAEHRAVRESRLTRSDLSFWFLEAPQPPPINETQERGEDEKADQTLPANEPSIDAGSTGLPQNSDYESSSPQLIKHYAIERFRQRDFKNAARLFDLLADHPEHYNDVSAQKHGQALLRYAVEDKNLENHERVTLLNEAKNLLKRSISHRDVFYQAYGHYELSKVYYRLAKITDDGTLLKKALIEIDLAIEKHFEQRYYTWKEYLLEQNQQ